MPSAISHHPPSLQAPGIFLSFWSSQTGHFTEAAEARSEDSPGFFHAAQSVQGVPHGNKHQCPFLFTPEGSVNSYLTTGHRCTLGHLQLLAA